MTRTQNDAHTALVCGYAAAPGSGRFNRVYSIGLHLALPGTLAATVFHGGKNLCVLLCCCL